MSVFATITCSLYNFAIKPLYWKKKKKLIIPFCDRWQDKEHPDMDQGHKEYLEQEFAKDIFPEEEGPVNDDEHKLGE